MPATANAETTSSTGWTIIAMRGSRGPSSRNGSDRNGTTGPVPVPPTVRTKAIGLPRSIDRWNRSALAM